MGKASLIPNLKFKSHKTFALEIAIKWNTWFIFCFFLHSEKDFFFFCEITFCVLFKWSQTEELSLSGTSTVFVHVR